MFKSILLIVWFTHVARKKEEFNELFELIEPPLEAADDEVRKSLDRQKTNKTATFHDSELRSMIDNTHAKDNLATFPQVE